MSGCPAWEEGICLALSRFTILHLCFSRPQSKLLSGEEIDRERANRLRDAVRSQPGLGPVVSRRSGLPARGLGNSHVLERARGYSLSMTARIDSCPRGISGLCGRRPFPPHQAKGAVTQRPGPALCRPPNSWELCGRSRRGGAARTAQRADEE